MPGDKQLPAKVAFVGSDERQSGTLQMTEVCRLLHGKGDIVVMIGELSNQSSRQRTQDVYDVIARPECHGIRVLDKQAANWRRTEAADLMTNWLSAGLRPQAVVANDDEMAIGAIQSLRQAKLLAQTVVAGIDATPDGLAAMKAGELKVTVFQNAPGQGRGAVDTALKLARGETVPELQLGAVRARDAGQPGELPGAALGAHGSSRARRPAGVAARGTPRQQVIPRRRGAR